jgi:hypothetical protein
MRVSVGSMMLPLAGVRQFLSARFPLHAYGPAILVSFYCLWWLYGGGATVVEGFPGAVSLVAVFLQARLIDDIEDRQGDRRHLMLGLALATVIILALNWGRGSWWVALAALAAMLAAPLGLKPLLARGRDTLTTGSRTRDALLFLAFEGAHVVTFLYVYAFWRSTGQPALSGWLVASATGLFWSAYLFWKYARAAARPEWAVFGMSWRRFRVILIAVLLLCLVCQLWVAAELGLSASYACYAVGGTAVFVAWMRRIRAPEAGALRSAIGLMFVAMVDLGLVLALAVRPT